MQYTWIDRSQGSIKNDVLSGLTVALALVPEAVAFAFVAGVSPVVGLYGALMMGVVTSIFGGRPGMISGATGAMAVVMAALVAKGNALGGDVVSLVVIFSGIPTETVASFIAARGGDSIKHYELVGPLFFGSTAQFATEFDVREDPEEVTIDFRDSRITDQSATEAINPLAEKYQKAGKRLHLRHLSKDCIRLIKRAGSDYAARLLRCAWGDVSHGHRVIDGDREFLTDRRCPRGVEHVGKGIVAGAARIDEPSVIPG